MSTAVRGSIAAVFILVGACKHPSPGAAAQAATFTVVFKEGCPQSADVDTPNCSTGKKDCLKLPRGSSTKVTVVAADPRSDPEFNIEVDQRGLPFEPNGPPDKPRSRYDVKVADAPPGEYKFSIVVPGVQNCRLDPTIIIE